MEKDQIIILEDRGLISISGRDAKEFLQNLISNDINKVNSKETIFSAIFTPQGKYLYEFFVLKSDDGYFFDCDKKAVSEIVEFLNKYKLSSNVDIKDNSEKFVIGIISKVKFKEIQTEVGEKSNTLKYRECPTFLDPRSHDLGGRILSNLEKLYLTIKKLKLNIVEKNIYVQNAHKIGIPIEGLEQLKNQLFGIEANLEKLNGIDFKKGCYIGQENTARMKIRNKVRKKLLPLTKTENLKIGEEIKFGNIVVGKVIIDKPQPFGLIKFFDPDFSDFADENLKINNKTVKIVDNH